VLSDNGYTTIFLPDDEGVKLYEHDGVTIVENAPPVLQGCRDERGLWYVPITDDQRAVSPSNTQETAMNVYDLPSTKGVVRFLHAALGKKIRNILEEMGHPQPPTPVQTDNSTADGIINLHVLPKRTKAMDMRYHWLRDRAINQQQFRFFWRPGALNKS
jgi:hypothetical protein